MAQKIKHLSKTDFKINGHYLYKDGDGKWQSNPPVDTSDVNLTQAIAEHVKMLES